MLFQHLPSVLNNALSSVPIILAQEDVDAPRGYTISIAIMLLSVVLGLFVALRPAKREEKVKLPKNRD